MRQQKQGWYSNAVPAMIPEQAPQAHQQHRPFGGEPHGMLMQGGANIVQQQPDYSSPHHYDHRNSAAAANAVAHQEALMEVATENEMLKRQLSEVNIEVGGRKKKLQHLHRNPPCGPLAHKRPSRWITTASCYTICTLSPFRRRAHFDPCPCAAPFFVFPLPTPTDPHTSERKLLRSHARTVTRRLCTRLFRSFGYRPL